MSKPVFVGYATRYGSTAEVAQKIASVLEKSGHVVEIKSLREVDDLDGYDAVVMGAPLFMYKWHRDAKRFLTSNRKALKKLPVAIFALGPTHDPHDEKEWQESTGHLKKELEKFPWLKPVAVEMFGGKWAPEKLKAPLRWLAGKEPATDIRDWEAIRSWANALPEKWRFF